MQSYQLHVVSEHLKRRHPYLEPPFRERYDPTEIYKAVFDRAIPKLIEILLMEGLAPQRYMNALVTLNEMASDETERMNMIAQGVTELASVFCHCKDVKIRRESTLLLGLILSTPEGLHRIGQEGCTAIKKLLFDQQLSVRQAVSWLVARMALSRDGAEILCKESIAKEIVEAFLKYSALKGQQEQYLVLYLLHCFQHLLVYDVGIRYCLGTGLTAQLKELTAASCYSPENNTLIRELALCNLSNIAMSQEGKEQCVREEVIQATEKFLESNAEAEVAHTVTLIMFTAVHLKGKKQCIYNETGKPDNRIVVKLANLYGKQMVSDIVKNDVKETLKIIAQEGDAFLAIADHMSRNCEIKHIEAIFGPEIIVPLALQLPSYEEIDEPPTLPSLKVAQYKAYAKTINHFFKKAEKEALNIALGRCINLCNKLVLFLCYRGDKLLQDSVFESITKIVTSDGYSKSEVLKFLDVHGQKEHKISKTTVKKELVSLIKGQQHPLGLIK